jgi:acyl-ACP thioesterase
VKASKQALLDAKAKVKSEWVIVKELRNRRSNMAQMEVEIARLTKERDEARRLHCHMSAQFMYKSVELDTAKHVANSKGWDCFEKETQ